jgi:hypothetical protein
MTNFMNLPSIRIHDEPYLCTDGNINPGSIIVQNYLTEHYLDRAVDILEKHRLEKILHFARWRSDPEDGDLDSILIHLRENAWTIDAALKEIREVSDTVEAADRILQKEQDARLEAEKEKFEKSVEAFKRIMEG